MRSSITVFLLSLIFLTTLSACQDNQVENTTDSEVDIACNDWVSKKIEPVYEEIYRNRPYFGGSSLFWPVDFVWAPNNQSVVLRNDNNALFLYRFDEDKLEPLTDHKGFAMAWSPNSQHIAFVADDVDNRPLIIMDVLTKSESSISNPDILQSGTAWWLDDQQLRYLGYKNNNYYLYQTALNDPDSVSSPILDFYIGSVQTWSPDMTRLAFVNTTREGNVNISIADIQQQSQFPLTITVGCDQSPDWSPTDDKIAFISDRTGNWDIFVIDTNDPEKRADNLTNSAMFEYHPQWSPDGKKIAFTGFEAIDRQTAKQDIFVLDTSNSTLMQITQTPDEYESYPQWSLDGQQIAFVTFDDGEWHLDSYNLINGTQNRLVTVP